MSREDEIRGRLGKVTPGPWEIDSIESGEHAIFADEQYREQTGCWSGQIAGFMTQPNCAFIANAPADVAFLLAEVDAAQARNAEAWYEGYWARAYGSLLTSNPYREAP